MRKSDELSFKESLCVVEQVEVIKKDAPTSAVCGEASVATQPPYKKVRGVRGEFSSEVLGNCLNAVLVIESDFRDQPLCELIGELLNLQR